ncbi:MAG TPA: hypothetical protein VN132_14770, partial [Bdellovibrio sp.]|nr:hypothetical protein [Bdellovibrio sp.]
MRDYSLNFDKPMESPQLENDAEYLQEWKVVQKITRGEEVYKYYRYQILQGPLHKITPTSADGVMESMTWLVDSTEQLREPREYRVREGINCWTLYNMGLVLRKK